MLLPFTRSVQAVVLLPAASLDLLVFWRNLSHCTQLATAVCCPTQGASFTAFALLLPAAIISLMLICLHSPLNLFCSSIEGVVKDKKEEGEVHAQIKGKDIKKNADPENPGYFVEQTKSELPASELAWVMEAR